MKWTAEADLVVGVTVGSGKRKLGFGVGIGRRKIIKRTGLDLGEQFLRRWCLYFLKDSNILICNWSLTTESSIYLDRARAMKRSNVINLILQMMPSSLHAAPVSADHWEFLEEVDAPQWADLLKEAALMGTQGDDPWFHRSHMHHETSLARAANLTIPGNASSTEIRELLTKRKVAPGKGSAPKLIKPSIKANVVKACLGGMQRVSNAGSKEGRLSTRPRVTTLLSTSQSRPRTPKKVLIQRTGIQKKAAPTVAGSDSRVAACEPSSNAATPKKSHEGKIGNIRRSDSVLNDQERQKTECGGTSRNGRSSDQSVTRSCRVSESSDPYGSPKSSRRLYRLPSPPNPGDTDLSTDGLKSSPSDMNFSSDASPTTSNSSQESRGRGRPASAALACKRKISTDCRSTEGRSKLQSAPLSRTGVGMNEPRLEIPSFKVLDRDLSNRDGANSSTSSPDWNQQVSNPRLKRRSLGPALRVKQIEKVGSSSVKKKNPGRLIDNQEDAPAEKLVGAQATHPILEKLRRSWGSALRVKQRQDAEVAVGNTRNDDSCQNSGACEPNGGSGIYLNNSENLRGKKQGKAQLLSDGVRRGQTGGVAMQSFEGQVLGKHSIASERAICQQSTKEIQPLDTLRRSVFSLPVSGNLRKSKSIETTEAKTVAPPASKIGLAKAQANYQRSKSDVVSKFKKQYAYPDTSLSKSLSVKGNKENMHLEIRTKAPNSPPILERKRKTQNVVPRSIMLTSARQLGPPTTVSQAVLPVNMIRSSQQGARTGAHGRTSPQTHTNAPAQTSAPARNLVTNRTGLAYGQSKPVQEAIDSSAHNSESLHDGKVNNVAILRGSTSSSLKLTKQKSEKISSSFAKESTSNAGPRGCKNGGQVVDECVVMTAENFLLESLSQSRLNPMEQDRKSRAAPKYEPRLHNAKAIKEWETKSGRRYYDLQPGERQKVNQEITAASKAVTKRTSA